MKYSCVRRSTYIILFYQCTLNTTGCPLQKNSDGCLSSKRKILNRGAMITQKNLLDSS